MKKIVTILISLSLGFTAFGQTDRHCSDEGIKFTEAKDLTIIGKVFPNTPEPYQRIDFNKYGGWTSKDIRLLKMSTGMAVCFRTDSPIITVKTEFYKADNSGKPAWAYRGYDLYIKKDGEWLWAYDVYAPASADESPNLKLIDKMDGTMHECLVYFPIYSWEKSIKIGVQEGSVIEPIDPPFRHNICIHGSSYMHGVSSIRAGATVPGFLTRATGLQFNSLAVSGDCEMQPQFLAALKDVDAEAFVFDAFSNPLAETIEARLFPFIEGLQQAHPGVPLIFISSIYREYRNFIPSKEAQEAAKEQMADSLMRIACKKYKDVYYVKSNATLPNHETSADGVHPDSGGYLLWAESIRKPLLKIFRRYGIK
ncbi:MAG: SGNH/GDSL hydrolase family protein [Bacteroidales bacterium]|nr:SGNH/GDSL hydrolase family protein [Bacteroidales bacterium]